MERSHSFNFRALHEKFSLLVSKVHDRGRESAFTLETLKTSRGLALVFVAVILAWISIETTESQATRQYQRAHWPKVQVWKQTLMTHGLSLQKNLGLYTDLLKSHPQAFSGEQKIWASDDTCAVYLPKSPYQASPELWTCNTSLKAAHWLSIGPGLFGFEQLTDLFEKTPLKTKATSKVSSYKIDPKEIRY